VRTAIAYLISLLCHGAVLIPLAHLSAWSDTSPRYSMQGGGPAAVSLKASLAAPNDGGEFEETQVVVAAMPPYGQPAPELPPPEPNLTVLPEAKVFAHATSTVLMPKPKPNGAAPALPHPRIEVGSATATPTLTPGAAAGMSRSAKNTVGQANRAAHPARHVGSGKPDSTGTDAVTVAASSGNAGGGQVDQAPSAAASNPVPPYPADALARGIEGLVLLRVRIGADGRVEEAAVNRSSGTPSLDESALSTVRRQWRFEPATRGGVAVSYEALLPIRFTIRAG
jgi:protein TonB